MARSTTRNVVGMTTKRLIDLYEERAVCILKEYVCTPDIIIYQDLNECLQLYIFSSSKHAVSYYPRLQKRSNYGEYLRVLYRTIKRSKI